LTRKATLDWLNTSTPVLDYANAMVPARQPNSAATATADWQEHVDGKPQFAPPIVPLAPCKFTGGLYIVTGSRAAPECVSFSTSLINSTGTYVQTVAPNGAGTSSGMLGYMFWAANVRPRVAFAQRLRIRVKAASELVQRRTAFHPMPPLRQN
jgi:hypothetical protein